ncbi:MAG: hypothetical protein KAJ51_13060, partial [Thermoplasmata archaeon]|nr:hypothetical protein [Thermoplasmata archaeon]
IDLVEKVLTFFGMMGGVQLECLDDATKWVKPGEEVQFQLKVTNLGKKTDTMELTTEISSQTSANENEWPSSRFEIDGAVEYEVDVLGTQSLKNYKDNVILIVTAPEWDLAAAEWKTEYTIKITANSANTGMTNSTTVKIIIDLYSNITVSYSQVYQEIDVDDYWQCTITINNNTNGDQSLNVELTIDGEAKDLASFIENDQNKIIVTLTPNLNRQVIVKIQSGEHELAGFHNITVEVKGAITNILHDKSTIATEIEQFYDVAINRTNIIPVVIDPNDEAGENFIESFNFQVQNFGNGYDSVNFKIESHPKYTVFEEWMTAVKIIFEEFELKTIFDDSELKLMTTETLLVHPYDESKVPAYGEAEITVTVDIPTNISHGEYWFNLIAESEAGLDSEENDENNN